MLVVFRRSRANDSGERTRLACCASPARTFGALAEKCFSMRLEEVVGEAPTTTREGACAPLKDCFGETPKPTRETRALPHRCLPQNAGANSISPRLHHLCAPAGKHAASRG